MDWQHIRHVPVEDQENRLVGLISAPAPDVPAPGPRFARSDARPRDQRHHDHARNSLARGAGADEAAPDELPPVVDGKRHLVGIISERDFTGISEKLLAEFLSG